jgi:hypothetical protein
MDWSTVFFIGRFGPRGLAHLARQAGVPRQLIVELLRPRGVDHITKDPQCAAQLVRPDASLMHYRRLVRNPA